MRKTTLEIYNRQRTAERLRREIMRWDHNDADVLRDLLVAFQNVRDALEQDRVYVADIDGSNLPSEPFPKDLTRPGTGHWIETGTQCVGYRGRITNWTL